MRSGATPIWISRRLTASARRCDTSRLRSKLPLSSACPSTTTDKDGLTHQPGGLRLERYAAPRSELDTGVAEEHPVTDLALEFGRLGKGGAQSHAIVGLRGHQLQWSHQSGPVPRAVPPTRSGRTLSALPRSRMPCERRHCAVIGAKLWLGSTWSWLPQALQPRAELACPRACTLRRSHKSIAHLRSA